MTELIPVIYGGIAVILWLLLAISFGRGQENPIPGVLMALLVAAFWPVLLPVFLVADLVERVTP